MEEDIRKKILKILILMFLISLVIASLTTFLKINMDAECEFTSSMSLIHSFSIILTIGLCLSLIFGYLHISYAILAIIFIFLSMGFWYKFSYITEYSEGDYIVRKFNGLGEDVLIYYEKENFYTLRRSHREIIDH